MRGGARTPGDTRRRIDAALAAVDDSMACVFDGMSRIPLVPSPRTLGRPCRLARRVLDRTLDLIVPAPVAPPSRPTPTPASATLAAPAIPPADAPPAEAAPSTPPTPPADEPPAEAAPSTPPPADAWTAPDASASGPPPPPPIDAPGTGRDSDGGRWERGAHRLFDLAVALTEPDATDGVVDAVIDEVARTLEATVAVLVVPDEDGWRVRAVSRAASADPDRHGPGAAAMVDRVARLASIAPPVGGGEAGRVLRVDELPPPASAIVAELGLTHLGLVELRGGSVAVGGLMLGWVTEDDPGSDAEASLRRASTARLLAAAVNGDRAVARIRHQATHDELTGLAQRSLFADRVERALASARRRDRSVAVLFIDLDGFKDVNDSLGHEAGDQLLVGVARRLRAALRDEDTLARLGGDEFAVLLPEVRDAEAAIGVAGSLVDAIAVPVEVGRHRVVVTASIGVAVRPEDGNERRSLMRHADLAMYRAKALGRGRVERYTPELAGAAEQAFGFGDDLRRALEQDELRLRYQPQVSLDDGRICGLEVLVRWDHPTLGPLRPDEFLPTAQETGLVVAIDTWVIARACRDARAWRAAGLEVPRLGVNVVARDLADPDFPGAVSAIVDHTGVGHAGLELEVTEDVPLDSAVAVREALAALRARGVRLAIDDFGSRATVLGHLRDVAVDTIKIDGGLLRQLDGDRDGPGGPTRVLDGILALARSLGVRVVAEGVETVAQRDHLRALGCDAAQGYLFSVPLDMDATARLLREGLPVSTVMG